MSALRMFAVVVVVSLVCWSASAQATLINMDFCHDDSESFKLQTGAAVWGSAGDTWNQVNLVGSGSGLDDLVDSKGNATTVDVSETGNFGSYHSTGGSPMDDATKPLMYDFASQYTGDGGTGVLTISSLPANTDFSMVVYGADQEYRGANFALAADNGSDTGTTSATSRKISDGIGVAYDILYGHTDADGNLALTVSLSGHDFGGTNGFQLDVVPEPGTLALLATGLIGLLCYAWRKRK